MSVTASPLTVAEFLELPEKPGVKRELWEGVVFEMGAAHVEHEIVKSNFVHELVAYLLGNPIGRVLSETMFVLSETDSMIPDVSLLLLARLRQAEPGKNFQGAPDLAIEVVSSESAADLEHKVRAYLKHGAQLVWVAFPRERVVHVYDRAGNARVLVENAALDGGELLPGFELPLERVFAGVGVSPARS